MLFVRGIEEKKAIGDQQDDTVGYDKFYLEFHEIISLSCKIYQRVFPYGNTGEWEMIPFGNRWHFFVFNILNNNTIINWNDCCIKMF